MVRINGFIVGQHILEVPSGILVHAFTRLVGDREVEGVEIIKRRVVVVVNQREFPAEGGAEGESGEGLGEFPEVEFPEDAADQFAGAGFGVGGIIKESHRVGDFLHAYPELFGRGIRAVLIVYRHNRGHVQGLVQAGTIPVIGGHPLLVMPARLTLPPTLTAPRSALVLRR